MYRIAIATLLLASLSAAPARAQTATGPNHSFHDGRRHPAIFWCRSTSRAE